jgi:hypothetical protein
MALYDEIETILSDFGQKLQEDLQQSLRDKGVKAGGGDSRLSNSIKFSVEPVAGGISMKLAMPEYGEAVDKGRKAAWVSEEGQKSIAQWGKSRGYVGKLANRTLAKRIGEQNSAKAKNKTRKQWVKPKKPSFEKQVKAFVYVVNRKLSRYGYKGNGFYSEVVEDGRLEQLKIDLANVLKTNIGIEIIDLTKI